MSRAETASPLRVALVAGEPSGDQLGASLIEAVSRLVPDARFEGIAGPLMQAAGCRSIYPMERLSVMGLVEAAGRLLALTPVRRQMIRDWVRDPPDVFVGIDAPDFNLVLEEGLRRGGVPTVHYVSPSVWAWRRYRLRRIRRAVDLMLTLFPFEHRFYEEAGVPVRFVGHPLADRITPREDRLAPRRALGLGDAGPVVALLPGSRASEVGPLAPVMLATARWLLGRRPEARFVLPLATPALRALVEPHLDPPTARSVHFVDGRATEAMAAADVVLLASGTATLEALLIGRPMVITYRTRPLTWAIGRRLLHVDHVGLPNLLAGRRLVPELLQDAATPQRLGAAVLAFLEEPARAEALGEPFAAIARELRRGAAERAARAVIEVAGR
ncbi:MAG: lipid-A-disaccharide synthase [Chromatiales bacterium]|nr:lipid-A-disaccharide synthase [Chromatiales bacterium]